MAEFADPFVVHFDDGRIELVGMVAGPAGAAAVEVTQGVVLQVDFAEPRRLSSIVVEGTSPATDAWMDRLVGRSRWAVARTVNGERPLRVEGTQDALSSVAPRQRRPGATSAAAVLASLAEDPNRTELARAVAHLELAHHLRERASQLDPDDSGALAAIEAAKESLGAAHGDALRIRLAGRDLKKLLVLGHFEGRRDDDLVRAIGEVAMLLERPDRGDRGSIVLDRQPRIDLRAPGRLDVRVDRAAGAWVRVVHARKLVPLSLAPLLPSGGEFVAELIVPPDVTRDDLSITITDEPLLQRRATTHLEQVRDAIRVGRRAVEFAAIGRGTAARERWRTCGEMWRQLGDEHRANLADLYAADPPSARRPSLSETIEAEFHRSAFTSV